MRDALKKYVIEVIRLLWSFRWYLLVYLLFFLSMWHEYLNPPEKDSPIWGAEAMEGDWAYLNKEVYMGNLRQGLIIVFLFFLIGTSNMRNHPMLAKIIFISPLFGLVTGLIMELLKN